MGRPKKPINKVQFEKLCELQATIYEVASVLDVSHDTIQRWCEFEYGMPFKDVYEQKSAGGKVSLRRTQFKLAQKNTAMAIWLGKQWLGQKDVVTINSNAPAEDDPLTKSIKDTFNALE